MTASEIKDKSEQAGLKTPQLAEKIGINAEHLAKIFSGARPMPEQLKRHILLAINEQKTANIAFSVSLPDCKVSHHVHNADKLTDAEHQQVAQSIRDYLDGMQAGAR